MTRSRLLAAIAASSLLVIGSAACAPPEKKDEGSQTESGVNAKEATSAADFGGIDKLVEAAKAEKELNVIALPPDWANYKEIIDTFSSKYGIKVNSAQPDANSQDEINAANQQKGKSTAPDVFDLGQAIALANTKLFAPYKVEKFDDIPAEFKDPDGTWVNDYGGYTSIGYDSAKVPEVTAVADLLKPEFKGKVALNGDPTTASAAANGVLMTALANGGSVDDIAPGVNFFVKLKEAGNFVPVDPTPATIESGQTPVVIDWDYLNAAETKKIPTWKVFVPNDALVGGYYFQAINKDGPHPAAARLWQEFLYSDEGQNLFLKGLARPVLADAMEKAGTVDKTLLEALPKVDGKPVVPTDEQSKKMADYLGANWSKVIS
jgi:putative spermidine/putrescine transport system substrate-binding protein